MPRPPQRPTKISERALYPVLFFALAGTFLGYLSLIHSVHDNIHESNTSSSSNKELKRLEVRIKYLETKLDSYLAFGKDPFLSNNPTTECTNETSIKDIACPDPKQKCEIDNLNICIDNFPLAVEDNKFKPKTNRKKKKKKCVVYDFGIRESPEFGLTFAHHCEVVGFDPSPISIEWWKKEEKNIKKKYPAYQFMGIGAGGINGDIKLHEYDWGQVSILEFPYRVINTTACNANDQCRYSFYDQKSFKIPVRTLKSIMDELKHDRVDFLKLDVEGSEYAFLERMIDDLSCRKVDQMAMEWHHYDYDVRYGVTSNPQVNVLVALLRERCGLEQFYDHPSHGWPSNQKIYAEMGMTLYYNTASFKRTKWKF